MLDPARYHRRPTAAGGPRWRWRGGRPRHLRAAPQRRWLIGTAIAGVTALTITLSAAISTVGLPLNAQAAPMNKPLVGMAATA